jgi:hypothetical protein
MDQLKCYASSFLEFLIENLVNDSRLKIIRIGIRLIEFILRNFEHMDKKTSLSDLAAIMLEMLNDPKGILR